MGFKGSRAQKALRDSVPRDAEKMTETFQNEEIRRKTSALRSLSDTQMTMRRMPSVYLNRYGESSIDPRPDSDIMMQRCS